METTQEERDAREAQLNDVISIVNWLKCNPEIPLPMALSGTLQIFAWDSKEEAAQMARAMGSFEKSFDANWFRITKSFGSLKLQGLFTRSNVCERIVVGTKEVETEEADPVAVAAIPKVKVRKTVEIVEWVCSDSLLGTA
jgi:hypothetical protein